MITIRFNEATLTIAAGLSLAEVLAQQNQIPEHYAIALNRHFIPRTHYTHTHLQEGDVIEMIAPMQGG